MQSGRLKDFVLINKAILPRSTADDYLFNYIEINNVDHNGIISKDNIEKIYFADAPSRARKVIIRHDIILSSVRPNLQAVAYIDIDDEDLICSTGFNVVHIERLSSVFPKYIYYFLISHNVMHFFISVAKGVGYPAVDEKDFVNIKILLPPFFEQKLISAYLDKTTSIIDKAVSVKKEQLKKLEELKKSIIYKAVTKGLDDSVELKDSGIEWIGKIPEGWEVKRIKRNAYVKRGASPRPIDNPIYFDDEGEFAWVRIADVSASDRYLEVTTQKLSELGASLSVKQYPGDLIISIAGTVGKPIISKIKCCIHDGFVWFEKPSFFKDFLYYIFLSEQPYKGLGKLGTQLNLNTDTIGQIFITYPNLNEQQAISEYLDRKTSEINSVSEKITLQIEKLESYKKSLIHECVTGKRRITEADIQEAVYA